MKRNSSDTIVNPTRAVASYVRMSTEHQNYSTKNQMDAITTYADENDMEIVATFSDQGKSGLTIKGRAGLSSLLTVVNSGDAPFSDILVYDVSRWGRFQNSDESAYYEYQCTLHDIKIHYCSENFDNDGSPLATIIKSLKRAMAGEYSRELSVKVFAGQCRLVKMGFRQGGAPGYGLRRMVIDEFGNRKQILERNQHKNIQTDRVILVPGPQEEVDTVNKIFELYVRKKISVISIVNFLNENEIKTDRDTPWTDTTVTTILKNEKYIGNNIYNRSSAKLQSSLKKNKKEDWIRVDGCFEPVVPAKLFRAANKIFKGRTVFKTDQ